jgi:hypothetical protein
MPMKPAVCLVAGAAMTGTVGAAPAHLEYRINGVHVIVDHARGAAADRLIAAHLERARLGADGQPARWTRNGDWRQLASVSADTSNVLQVRGSGENAEAIHSALALRQAPRESLKLPLWMPPAASIVNEIEMLDAPPAVQWVIRSPWSVRSLAAWWRAAANMQGWTLGANAGNLLQFQRGQELVHISLQPALDMRNASIAVVTAWGRK